MVFEEFNEKKCILCEKNPRMWGLSECRECFAKMMKNTGKTLEERVLDLEIQVHTPHSHLNNTIFG